MLDEKRARLAQQLFEAAVAPLEEAMNADLNALIGDATKSGAIGNGRFHMYLATRMAKELAIRGDKLWVTVARVLETSPSIPSDTLSSLTKEFILGELQQQRQRLEERLTRELKRFHAKDVLVGLLNDEFPKVRDRLFAEIELRQLAQVNLGTAQANVPKRSPAPDPSKIFVVHGRDATMTTDLFNLLRAYGLNPVEWGQAVALTGKGAPYIGEVLDTVFADAVAIVVLLSPDDEVRLHPMLWGEKEQSPETEVTLQPRPNVLFESGLAFGRHPDRTILVEVGEVKGFSDIAGRHTVRLSNSRSTREELKRRLETAGCRVAPVDDSWVTVGNFQTDRRADGRGRRDQISAQRPGVRQVDSNYPIDSGLQAELLTQGKRIGWCRDSEVARRQDIEGWELVIAKDTDGSPVILKIHDSPEDHTLMMRTIDTEKS